ncbi:hypothetical protein DNTS_010279 [Danionella cerebrum]|uniref:Uncharacterized protein n=1 Tax=Danionella cerebrum TaxID=2873325 RepID=A0A553MR97_9TELE|nr:hypothetical protein DNTS_010279 [Danionella translucida]
MTGLPLKSSEDVCRSERWGRVVYLAAHLSLPLPFISPFPSGEAEGNKATDWIAVIELNTLAPGHRDESSCGMRASAEMMVSRSSALWRSRTLASSYRFCKRSIKQSFWGNEDALEDVSQTRWLRVGQSGRLSDICEVITAQITDMRPGKVKPVPKSLLQKERKKASRIFLAAKMSVSQVSVRLGMTAQGLVKSCAFPTVQRSPATPLALSDDGETEPPAHAGRTYAGGADKRCQRPAVSLVSIVAMDGQQTVEKFVLMAWKENIYRWLQKTCGLCRWNSWTVGVSSRERSCDHRLQVSEKPNMSASARGVATSVHLGKVKETVSGGGMRGQLLAPAHSLSMGGMSSETLNISLPAGSTQACFQNTVTERRGFLMLISSFLIKRRTASFNAWFAQKLLRKRPQTDTAVNLTTANLLESWSPHSHQHLLLMFVLEQLQAC